MVFRDHQKKYNSNHTPAPMSRAPASGGAKYTTHSTSTVQRTLSMGRVNHILIKPAISTCPCLASSPG